MQPPSTVTQLVLVVVCVLPGVTYQFVRERARGPVPGETDLGHRLLRALTASIVLDGVYLAVLGRNLVEMLRPDRFPGDPRGTALYALVLLFGVPASSAAVLSWRERRRLRGRFRATPTAWDHMFRDRGPSYVRARLKDPYVGRGLVRRDLVRHLLPPARRAVSAVLVPDVGGRLVPRQGRGDRRTVPSGRGRRRDRAARTASCRRRPR